MGGGGGGGGKHQCTAQFETSLIFRVQVGLHVVKK